VASFASVARAPSSTVASIIIVIIAFENDHHRDASRRIVRTFLGRQRARLIRVRVRRHRSSERVVV
jgi:hypothetical protein